MRRLGFLIAVVLAGSVAGARAALQFTNVSGSFNTRLNAVVYDGSTRLVAVGDNSRTLVGRFTGGGMQWQAGTMGVASTSLSSAAYGAGVFVAGGVDSRAYRSTDGLSWSDGGDPFANTPYVTGLSFNGGRFAAVASAKAISYAGSSLAWAPANVPGGSFLESYRAVTPFGASGFASCGIRGNIRLSTDGVNWQLSRSWSSGNPDLLGIASDGAATIVAVGTNGTVVVTTTGGSSWSQLSTNLSATMNAVDYSGSEFVAAGSGGTVFVSTSGTGGWSSKASGTGNNLRGIAFGRSGQFQGVGILVGDNGTVLLAGSLPEAPTTPVNQINCSDALPNPALSVTVAPDATHPDGTVTVDWYDGEGNRVTNNSTSFIPPGKTAPLNAPATYSYFARARDLRTGFVSATNTEVVLTINPRPTATITSPDTTVCDYGTPFVVTNILTGLGPWTVIWNDGTMQVEPTAGPGPVVLTRTVFPVNTFGANEPSNNVYFVTSVTNSDTCGGRPGLEIVGVNTVTVNPRPTATLTSVSAVECDAGTVYTLTNVLTGIGPWTVTWNDGFVQNQPATGPGPVILTRSVVPASLDTTHPSNNVFSVTAVANANTCMGNQPLDIAGNAAILVNPRPTATVGGSTVICSGDTAPILSAALTGQGPWDVTWSDGVNSIVHTGVGGNGTTGTDTLAGSTNATTTYRVIALTDTPLSGPRCSAQAGDLVGQATVTVNPRPTANVSGSTVICNGDTAPVITAALTGQGPWDVTWFDGVTSIVHTGVGGTGTSGTDTLTGSTNTTTTYRVIALTDTPLAGPRCSAWASDLTGQATVTVNPRPTAAVSGSTVICNGDTAPTITAALTGQGPWDVTWFDGVNTIVHTGVGGTGTTGNDTLAGSTNATTTYRVIALTDTPLAGPRCTAWASDLTGQATVTVNPRPTAAVTGSTVICGGDTAPTITAQLTGHGPWDVTWFDGVNSIVHTGVGGNGTTGTDTLVGSTNTTTTYQVIALTDTPLVGPRCSAWASDLTGQVTVTVNLRPTAAVSGSTVICNGDAPPTVTAALTGQGPWDVTWFDGVNSVVHTSVGGSGTTGTDTLAGSTNATTTYRVIALTDTPLAGPRCSALASDLTGQATITVNPRPTAVVSGSKIICSGETAPTLTAALTGQGPWDVTWFDGVNSIVHTGVGGNGTTGTDTLTGSNTETTTYRVIALTDTPLAGPRCSALASDLTGQAIVTVNARPAAPTNPVSQIGCFGVTNLPLSVTLPANSSANWYTVESGGTPVHSGAGVFNPSNPIAGTNRYYVATVDTITSCESTNRAEVDLILETCTTNLSIVLIDTNVVVSWYGNYVLESSTNLWPAYWSFAWLGVGGTNNWYTNLVVPQNMQFYRLYAPTN